MWGKVGSLTWDGNCSRVTRCQLLGPTGRFGKTARQRLRDSLTASSSRGGCWARPVTLPSGRNLKRCGQSPNEGQSVTYL